MKPEMTSRERLLTTISHREPDRVPVAPRVWAWLKAECGEDTLAAHLKAFPEMDQMFIVPNGTPNYLDTFAETCDLPGVSVEQRKSMEGELIVIERTIGEKTTIKGHIDLLHVVRNGTPALIDATVRQAMEIAKPGGGFIIGSSDSFREGTPRGNVEAYFEACLRYGAY